MPDIFTYIDYRKFLADYYFEQKSKNPSFSYQFLSDKAGFPNKGYIYNVICGRKNLSKSAIIKLMHAIKLNHKEADYFDTMVSYNQAKNPIEKNYLYEKLNQFKNLKKNACEIRETRKDQYQFYSKWYLNVIRSIIDLYGFAGNYARLAKCIYPPIKPGEVKKGVALLLKLGLIAKSKSGTYSVTNKTITAGKDIIELGLLNFQVQVMERAKEALTSLPRDKRHISSLTLGISRNTYKILCKEIESLQLKILELAEQDEQADNVYQMNFQLFPMTTIENNGCILAGKSKK